MDDIDFTLVADRVSFAQGILWLAHSMRIRNDGILKDMHEFDGADVAEGVRIAVTKQNNALVAIETVMKAFLDET